MKKFIFTLFLMIGAICGNAQTAKIYKDGTVVQSIDNIDSVRFSQETTPVDEPAYTFSVAADKKVVFSPGNLQYTQSTNTWAFAEHQYDIIGKANTSEGALADKIDLFGWSSSNPLTRFGVSTSKDNADYAGAFVDWGTNTIGGVAPNTWRTLTNDEWYYLRYTRTNANNLVGVARITLSGSSYVNGLILLPDDWSSPLGVVFKSGFAEDYGEQEFANYQTIPLSDWQKMEAAGAVFLPAVGYRSGSDVNNVGSRGYYWSATPYDENYARNLDFYSYDAYAYNWNNRNNGQSVRLVQDVQTSAAGVKEIKTQVVTVYQSGDKAHRFADVDSVVVCPTVILPPPAFSVAADKKVVFSPGNLQYTQSTNTWAFAEHQYDFLGNANMNTDNTVADRIDLFGWSADNTTAPFGIRLSTNNADYAGAFVDWGTNAIGTYAPNTWRTLTKGEWEYLLTTRANATERMGVARINLNDAGSEFANGVILLPDDWTCPAGVTFKSGSAASDSEAAYGEYQTFTLAQWQALEESGAVFLHAAGDWRPANTYVGRINQYGYVHTATTHDSLESYAVNITSNRAAYMNWDDRKGRKSVRLVRDIE